MKDEAQLTLTSDPQRAVRPRAVNVPYLYLVLECDRPTSLSARFCLADAPRIEIGRGADRSWSKHPLEGFRVNVPDRCMSSKHAAIHHAEDGSWILRDLGSKNGSFVNGVQVSEQTIQDGDIIELGHTFFRFRLDAAVTTGSSVLDGAALRVPLGLRTLLPALEQTFSNVAKLASSGSSLLILGETGTGKEVIARGIHELSRRPGSFVGVNCGALPANLVESELFGSKKGAFSGATEDRIGLVRAADNGTLLLDEVGDLPMSSQASLLRVLQESEVVPVGASKPVSVKLRVLAATHHDLERLVGEERFRGDLLARLNGFTIRLPPLRERREDLGLLIGALAERNREEGEPAFVVSPEAARVLFHYDFPLNVRELEQVLRAALVLASPGPGSTAGATSSPTKCIGLEHLPDTLREGPRSSGKTPLSRRSGKDDGDRKAQLIARMKEHHGNVSAVARAMGTARMQIHRWIRQYDVDPEDYRVEP